MTRPWILAAIVIALFVTATARAQAPAKQNIGAAPAAPAQPLVVPATEPPRPVARQPDFKTGDQQEISDFLRYGTFAKPAPTLASIIDSGCVGDFSGQCRLVGYGVLNDTRNMFLAIGNMCSAIPADPAATGDALDLSVVYCLRTTLMEYSRNVEGVANPDSCTVLAKRKFEHESVLCFSKGLVLSEIPACDAKNKLNADKKRCFFDTLTYIATHSDKGRLISARDGRRLTAG